MGFWPELDAKIAALPVRAKASREPRDPTATPKVRAAYKQFDEIERSAKGCEGCELRTRWPQLLSSRMRTVGPANADILILGEAPDEDGDKEGQPFVGKIGKMLDQSLPRAWRDRLAFQNMVRCRPADSRAPTLAEMHSCSGHIEQDLQERKIKAILGIGGAGLHHFVPRGFGDEHKPALIGTLHGTKMPVRIGDRVYWYYPTFHPSYVLRVGGENTAAYSAFANDIKNFFRDVDYWSKPEIFQFDEKLVHCCYTEDEARKYLAQMRPGPLTIDFETNALAPYEPNAKVLSASASDSLTTISFPVQHREAPNDWGWKIVEEIVTQHRWVAHNAAFELMWIWHHMGDAWQPTEFEDTMVYARFYHERETILSLAMQSRIHLGVDVKQIHPINRRRMEDYPLSEILPYGGLDSWATHLIFNRYQKGMLSETDWSNIRQVTRTVKSCTRMEMLGLPIDTDARWNDDETLYEHFTKAQKTAEARALNLYEAKQYVLKYQKPFNIGSPEHVGTALVEFGKCDLPKTVKKIKGTKETVEGKQYSTEDKELERLARDNPLALAVQDYREATKVVSTYLDPFRDSKAVYNGIFHPGYKVVYTATLRLSSGSKRGDEHSGRETESAGNIQNWPKRKNKEIRRQVKAPPGHVIVPIDEGQLEARVMAMLSRDRFLCDAIFTGYDIHGDWRDRIIKIYPAYLDRLASKSGLTDEKKLLKHGRNQIKNDFVFASFFGSSVGHIVEYTGMPHSVVEEAQFDFWQTFRGVHAWIKEQRQEYKRTGLVTTMNGLRRRAVLWGNECINTPVQGTAAHLVTSAQADITDLALEMRDPYLIPRINVHDDLTFIWPDDDNKIEYYFNIVAPIMTANRYPWMIVPLMVEASIGYNWADVEEFCKYTGEMPKGQHAHEHRARR